MSFRPQTKSEGSSLLRSSIASVIAQSEIEAMLHQQTSAYPAVAAIN
jgi:hypothetical protein